MPLPTATKEMKTTHRDRVVKIDEYAMRIKDILREAESEGIWLEITHGIPPETVMLKDQSRSLQVHVHTEIVPYTHYIPGGPQDRKINFRMAFVEYADGNKDEDSLGANPAVPCSNAAALKNEEYTYLCRELIPVWREENKHLFVSPDVLPIRTVMYPDGKAIKTAPLLFGSHSFDLLMLSQTEDLLSSGTLSATDHLDPIISLKRIYFEAVLADGGGSIMLAVNPSHIPYCDAVPAHYGDGNNRLLQFEGSLYMPDEENVQYAGNLKDATCVERLLAWFKWNSLTVDIKIHGSFNVITGKSELYSNVPMWSETQKSHSVFIDSAPFFSDVKAVGYDLDSNRSNRY